MVTNNSISVNRTFHHPLST